MPDINKTNNRPDDFSNLIRQKLEDHRMPVDNDCWDEIELHMKPGKKRFVWWIGGSAAAIAVIIVLLLFIQHDEEPSIHLADTISIENNATEEPISSNTKKEKLVIIKTTKSIVYKRFDKKESVEKQETDIIVKDAPVYPNVIVDTIHLADNNMNMADLNKEDENIISDTISMKKSDRPIQSHVPDKILIAKANNEDNKWLLAASISSGGGVDLSNSLDMAFDYESSSPGGISPPFLGSENEFHLNEFSDVNHSLPISFGVSVRKDLNKYIGIETGLVYTYLSSKFKKTGNYKHIAQQELHYLGIPLNLVVYMQNTSEWNFYFTVGVMGEKGIQFNYKQDVYKNNERITSFKDRVSINGMQWSFNASIGISYNFYKDWSIYFEPRYSYYFDSNQPINIRTEKPNVFGLGAGLRYKF